MVCSKGVENTIKMWGNWLKRMATTDQEILDYDENTVLAAAETVHSDN